VLKLPLVYIYIGFLNIKNLQLCYWLITGKEILPWAFYIHLFIYLFIYIHVYICIEGFFFLINFYILNFQLN
jgi:hypothetical protein